jgi:hypothetical protein
MANFIAFQLDAFQNDAFQTYVVEISIDELRRFSKVYSVEEDNSLVACSDSEKDFVFSQIQTLTVSTGTDQIFIQHQPKRTALEQNGN